MEENNWICSTDQLPIARCCYIVYAETHCTLYGKKTTKRQVLTGSYNSDWSCHHEKGWEVDRVTHWMPYPEREEWNILSKKHPQKEGSYIVTKCGEEPFIADYYIDENDHCDEGSFWCLKDTITHWVEIPDPPNDNDTKSPLRQALQYFKFIEQESSYSRISTWGAFQYPTEHFDKLIDKMARYLRMFGYSYIQLMIEYDEADKINRSCFETDPSLLHAHKEAQNMFLDSLFYTAKEAQFLICIKRDPMHWEDGPNLPTLLDQQETDLPF